MKKLLFILVSVLICGSAAAQHKITGKVTDQLGCSLTGAIVQVEGKENLKTVTDKNGDYTISVPKSSTHLIYSYPNMNKTMVDIQGRSKIDVTMTLVRHLQEVFYGTDDNSKILYLVDGNVVSKEQFDKIPQSEIQNVNVMKGISSAIVVNTKGGAKTNGEVIAVRGEKKSADTVNPITTQVTTVTVDKRKTNPLQIQTEEKISIKGDDDNSFGPIGIDTYRTGADTEVEVAQALTTGQVISISKKSDNSSKVQPLVVVKSADGKITTVKDIKEVNVSDIMHVTVIKNETAKADFKKYGDTSEGVIYIELKDKTTPKK